MPNHTPRITAIAPVFVLIALLFTAGIASAQEPPAAAAPQGHSILEELKLTPKQQAAINEAMHDNLQQLQPQLDKVMQKRAAFERVDPSSSSYQATVNDLAESEADFARARTLREGALRTTINEVLSPTQRTKLKELVARQQAARAQTQTPPAPPTSR